MTVVPTKLTFIGGVASLAVIGAVFTLVHRSAALPTSYNADSSTSADITPTLASQGVVENPPVSVTVNGNAIPVKPGTTRVDTPGGTATVQLSGNSASVDSQGTESTSSTKQGSVNVSVSSSSSGNTGSNSSTFVDSSSDTTVSGSGNSSVHIETNNSN
jgi:hypothetical protein